MRCPAAVLIALLLAAKSVPATGETGPTLYVGSGFSVAGEQDTRINDPTRPAPPASAPALGGVDFDFKYQNAALAELGLGYRVMSHLRVEANVSYRQHELENVQYRAGKGDVHFLAGMANLYADYALGGHGENEQIPILIPYVGAGVGVLWTKPSVEVSFPDRKVRGEGTEFAWNLMMGTEIPITRFVALNFGYRYLESMDQRWLLRNGSNGVGDVDAAYRTHEGRVGLRIGY